MVLSGWCTLAPPLRPHGRPSGGLSSSRGPAGAGLLRHFLAPLILHERLLGGSTGSAHLGPQEHEVGRAAADAHGLEEQEGRGDGHREVLHLLLAEPLHVPVPAVNRRRNSAKHKRLVPWGYGPHARLVMRTMARNPQAL